MKTDEIQTGDRLGGLLNHAYRFALALTHDAPRAEDLVQEACLAVIKAKGPWKRQYLLTAVRTRFIDHLRRDQAGVVVPLDGEAHADPADEARLWDLALPIHDQALLERALGELRPHERSALYLSAVEGYTAREISELLDLPRGTVLSLMYRGRNRLRSLLEQKEVMP